MLYPGTAAPDFTLPDQHGEPLHLAGLRGGWVLLWWYPKAATPG
jgi:peroxiredoxin Q/BCP